MEHMHPHLRLAASLILAAGLASACSGGGSGTAAMPTPTDPDPEPTPTVVRTPTGCTDASAMCTVTTNGAVTRLTTNAEDTTAMTNTRTITAGSTRTITVTSTATGHDNRVNSIETCTVSGNSCTRTSREERTYTTAGGNTAASTVTRTYTMGRETRRVTVMGDTTTTVGIGYSSSNGGRTERTVTSAGTRVQTFSQFSGGTATSTVFTSTDGLTVTTANAAGMRVETVYANAADAQAGQNPRSMTVGMARQVNMADADTGFAAGDATRTVYVANPVALAGQTLVSWTATVRYDADGDPEDPVIASRTYITASDTQGRETRRETRTVSNGLDGAVTVTVTTAYPEAGGMTETTVTGTRWTRAATDAMGTVTTDVRAGTTDTADLITRMIANPAASDGSRTVDTVFGPAALAADRRTGGHRDRVRTNADGTTVTSRFTGAGVTVTDEDDWVTVSVTTRDENGVETMLVTFSGNDRTTTTTAYMIAGSSTVTTVTARRASATAAYMTRNTVVVTNDNMGREVLRVTTDSDGDETDRRVTVYAADGSSTQTRTFSGGMGDMLMDTGIIRRAAPTAAQIASGTMGTIEDDIVVHPGVQEHAIVSDAEYTAIRDGLAVGADSKTVMGQALLHLNYENSPALISMIAFGDRGTPPATMVDFELELISQRPTSCTGSSCTYERLKYYTGPYDGSSGSRPESRTYITPGGSTARALATPGGIASGTLSTQQYPWGYGSDVPATNNNGGIDGFRPDSRAALFELLSDLLNVGGSGVSTTFRDYTAADGDTAAVEPRVVVTRTDLGDALDRNTYTYLKTTDLPNGVLGIGQQVKEVDSYLRLGGSRGATDAASDDAPVRVRVENYFGWMENSMFTVRRATAQNVPGTNYDWTGTDITGPPDTASEIRGYIGIVSGDNPSIGPVERRAAGMVDPGTWTGAMIGVGSVQGERYRGRTQVSVDFNTNQVTTKFDQIRLALDSAADLTENPIRFQHVSGVLTDQDGADDMLGGITFTTSDSGPRAGIMRDGSYTAHLVTGGVSEPAFADSLPEAQRERRFAADPEAGISSSLSAQFYGDGATEVAGTFNAYGLALGKAGDETTADLRGDLVGAFGAIRDPMTEAESN